MKILFIHQNYPGQFRHLAPALVREGHEVLALTMVAGAPAVHGGVQLFSHAPKRGNGSNVHAWAMEFETKLIRAESGFHAMRALRTRGFVPDVVIAHPGWGDGLFVKQVWPSAVLGIYCEFFYQSTGLDIGFDPEFAAPDTEWDACRLSAKNAPAWMQFSAADAGLSPTHWQAQTYPQPFRQRISVAHEGINTAVLQPKPQPGLRLACVDGTDAITLDADVPLVTFVNRNLEPYRGFHVFMRALPVLLRRYPGARVAVVGGDGVGYGAAPLPDQGSSWKQIFIDELRPKISPSEWSRVHFLGNLPYPAFISLLQRSTVHVYLTYPFVLSWSLLEAMSIGCAIVASDTAPVREAMIHGETGILVDFFDAAALAKQIGRLLNDPEQRARLGASARQYAIKNYDLETVCLPQQLAWVDRLVHRQFSPVTR